MVMVPQATDRLLLRELTLDDQDDLFVILGDEETMRFYPSPKTREQTIDWIEWNVRSYQEYGFGLWALILKETGEFVGDCGLTMQEVDGESFVEVGYHVKKTHWRHGLATEAATACRDHAFDILGLSWLIALVNVENVPSAGLARKLGMMVWKETMRSGLRHLVYSMGPDGRRRSASQVTKAAASPAERPATRAGQRGAS